MSMTPGPMGTGTYVQKGQARLVPRPELLDPGLEVEGLQAGVQPPPVQDLTYPTALIA